MNEKEKNVLNFIVETAKRYFEPQKVILFGSRATHCANERADFDIAIDSPNISRDDWIIFSDSVRENAPTLCNIDLIWLNSPITDELKNEINLHGIVFYDSSK